MKVITCKKLMVDYGGEPIVKSLNLSLPKNKITSIIGPNGCGKSTLLKALSNIHSYQGQVLIDERDIQDFTRKKLAQILAMLPQKPESTNGLTVEELVTYGRHPYASRFGSYSQVDYDMINWALEVTGLDLYKKRDINTLSGGQKQRVWIALCLAQDTDIIFLDEPTTYLDIAHQLEILEILEMLKIKFNKTIVMVLHDLNQASKYSDYIIALKDGHVVEEGDSQTVICERVLSELFGIKAKIVKDESTDKPLCLSFNLLN